jgi:hypothetical protein
MIDIEIEAEKIAKIAQLRKTEICTEDNGISDMQSFVVFQKGDMFECRQSGKNGHPFESLPDVLSEAYDDGLDEFDTVSIVVDSYIRLKKLDSVTGYQNGDLAKEYKNNPNSSVSEALTVVTYGYDGGSAGKCVTYVYNDRGLPEFTVLDDSEKETVIGSQFVDFVMSRYIEFCKKGKQQ